MFEISAGQCKRGYGTPYPSTAISALFASSSGISGDEASNVDENDFRFRGDGRNQFANVAAFNGGELVFEDRDIRLLARNQGQCGTDAVCGEHGTVDCIGDLSGDRMANWVVFGQDNEDASVQEQSPENVQPEASGEARGPFSRVDYNAVGINAAKAAHAP